VPFGFLRRKKEPDAVEGADAPIGPAASDATRPAGGRGVAFDGLTEEWRLVGRMEIAGRLSDALNRREAIPLADVRWAPLDGSAPFSEAPGLRSVDPYDLIMVLAGEESQPPLTEAERVAHKVHKVPYDVSLEAPPFRVEGTVFLYPGSDPERLLERANEMFLPVVDAAAFLGELQLSEPGIEAILVNRLHLRGVTQVDRTMLDRPARRSPATGELGPPEEEPGH
jgi:hypothetical protein